MNITLARDPFGIKPLFLRTFADGSLAFASELRPLARLAPKPELDRSALAGYLHLGAVAADASFCQGIAPLAANRWERWASPTLEKPAAKMAEGEILSGEHPFTETVDRGSPWSALLESVELQLQADVPTALLLSSGIDSTLIACAAHRQGRSLECFTVKVADARNDESVDAAITARRYGHRHHVVPAELTDVDVKEFFSSMQRPTIDGLNSFLVSKAIHAEGYRVALSGIGADEATAGYPHMRYLPLLTVAACLDRLGISSAFKYLPMRHKLSHLVGPKGPRDAGSFDLLFREILSPTTVASLSGVPETTPRPTGERGMRSMIEAEIEYYLQRTLLPDADAFSMRWSLELRVPFLDVPYFGAAARSANLGRGKGSLVLATGDARLNELTRRRKVGFNLPMSLWIAHGPLRSVVEDMRRPSAPIWSLIDYSLAQRALATEPSGRWAPTWAFAVLNTWVTSFAADEMQ